MSGTDSFSKCLALPDDYFEKQYEEQSDILITDINRMFGYVFYLIRDQLQLSQEKMANIIGMTKSGYSKIEIGTNGISLDLIFIVGRNFYISHETLLSIYTYLLRLADTKCGIITSKISNKPSNGLQYPIGNGMIIQPNEHIKIYTPISKYKEFLGIDEIDKLSFFIKDNLKIKIKELNS